MLRAGIHDRDIAAVDRSLTAVNDSVVVAVIDRQLSAKRYRIEGNVARLAFDSNEMPAFTMDEGGDVEIWGVVRFSIRRHIGRRKMVA